MRHRIAVDQPGHQPLQVALLDGRRMCPGVPDRRNARETLRGRLAIPLGAAPGDRPVRHAPCISHRRSIGGCLEVGPGRRSRPGRSLHHDPGTSHLRGLRRLARLRARTGTPSDSCRFTGGDLPGNHRQLASGTFARRGTTVDVCQDRAQHPEGRPTSRVLDLACPGLYADRAVLHEGFKMLKQAHVGKFRYFVDDGLAARPQDMRTVR